MSSNKEKKSFIDDYIKTQRELERLIRSGELEVEQVDQYLRLKIDINSLVDNLAYFEKKIGEKELKYKTDDKIYFGISALPSYYLSKSLTSYISPAYFLNQYLDTLNQYTLNDFKNLDNKNLERHLNIYVQSIFSSIKTLIDRLVPLMSFYYSGISLESTFGRIKSSGKARGLMQKVMELKGDPLMDFILENYDAWIKGAVAPRDLITHYNDFSTRYQHTIDGRTFPIHLEVKLFNYDDTNQSADFEEPYDYAYKSLNKYVVRLYNFINDVIQLLLKKEIKVTKQHFRNKASYEYYLKNFK